jgi:molybdopterin/thiamine biosynthesis adenylyltransferase
MGSSRRGLFRSAAEAAVRATLPSQAPAPDDLDLERYSRQLVLEGWGEAQQRRLQDASVLVVGAGALGSPVATYLVGAGIGRIGILDGDRVEVSNLHRQHLHWTPQVGRPKAHSAVEKLQLINPEVMVEPYEVTLDADNAEGLVIGHDLVVDCSDAFATRYLVNEACCVGGTWLVEGGVLGLNGMVMSIRPGTSACYRCAFPAPPPDAPTCASAGILGPAAGVVGSLMALEAMKLLAGLDGALLDAFLQVDLATGDFLRVATERRADCPDCGG